MSDYTKATNFTAKDALLTGNPSKVVRGSEIDDEFDAIAVAIATKANTASPTFTGTVTLPNSTVTAAMIASDAVTTAKILDANVTSAKLASGISPVGPHTIYAPASAMIPRTTNGAAPGTVETTTNKVMVRTLDFDASTDEFAQFSVRMPKGWNESTVTAYVLWSNASGTGDVVWGVQAVAISNDDVLDAAFGTAQTVTDSVTAAGDLMQSDVTAAITIAGTPAVGDWVVFQVYRDADAGGDTLAVDARLHGVAIIYTTDAGTDA